MTGAKLEVERVKVDAQGYDSSGAYWGAGPDVFILTSPDGAEQITMRATSVKDARTRAADILAGKVPGNGRLAEREPIGGNSRHVTRHRIDWSHPASGTSIRIEIRHARDYLSTGNDHIEIESIAPPRAALPITSTGYRSHFIDAGHLKLAGGAVAFVRNRLAQEVSSREWRRSDIAGAQADLFQWADAREEVGAKTPKRRARRPTSEPGSEAEPRKPQTGKRCNGPKPT